MLDAIFCYKFTLKCNLYGRSECNCFLFLLVSLLVWAKKYYSAPESHHVGRIEMQRPIFFTDDIKPLELETTETNTDNLIIFLLRGQTQDQCSSVANNDASNIPYESNPLLCRNISEL
jgi:hypothetical protein